MIDLDRLSELDRTTWPDVRDQIVNFTHDGALGEPRSYPGYPCWPLARCWKRPWPSLEHMLCSRRSAAKLTTTLPARATLSRLLQFSHGVCAQDGRGPTPSAGSLQALELYLANFSADWLPAGTYHYQRGAHSLAQLAAGADRDAWRSIVPSLELMEGGVLLWIIVGDGARVRQKYGSRAGRFLLLEAGHLMQNLCLMSQCVGWTTVPLGGFFELAIARRMALPADDAVLYLGILGEKLLNSLRRESIMQRYLMIVLALPASAGGAPAQEAPLDLTRAVVLTAPKLSGPEEKAVAMLIDEVEKRTQIRWQRVERVPDKAAAVVAVGRTGTHEILMRTGPDGGGKPEGYRVWAPRDRDFDFPTVCVAGHDARGVLFGVGHLLRKMEMSRHKVTLPADIRVASVPRTALRGHQLGYRPKTNSFDGWTLPMWEQYLRDLVIFGTNAIELIPPRSDDARDSPHFPLPPMEMMVGMSRLADQYGIDVWIWYPALDLNYGNPATVEFALNEWGEVFRKLPRIDAVFVPGGDPGNTPPARLMALLEKQTANLKKYHPKAQMWVSPQGFDKTWLDEFLAIVKFEPPWLSGIVHGPQVRVSLAQLRGAIPAKYPIRNYPDITHSLRCQYPVPDWDLAFAQTQGREGINPRPLDMAAIFASNAPGTGFITYSEGCNDDVNKMIWSGLGWDPDADAMTILRDYSRYFLGQRYTDAFAQGLLALERNWKGPALSNAGIVTALQQFQAMEKTASPQDKLNWRFQQALYRAYYDAYVRSRLLHETQLEEQAMSLLRDAKAIGAFSAMQEAEAILDRAATHRTASDQRGRVFELAEALFQSIRMQLSVERYQAISVGRGANLDTIDVPLNNRPWLKAQFAEIRKLDLEAARLARLDEIVNWTNPGPGGFYDDLGNAANQPHLVSDAGAPGILLDLNGGLGPRWPPKRWPTGYAADPEFRASPLAHFEERPAARRSWLDQALALFDAPLRMRYKDLDGAAHYKLKVVYGGGPIRLVANEKFEIHAGLNRTYQPIEFDIPPAATAGGQLALTWTRPPGGGGSGRGCQVAEVWLMRLVR